MGNMNCCSGRVKQQPSQNIDSILFPTQPNVEDADLYFQDDSLVKNKQMNDHFDSLSSDKFTETPEFLTSGTSPKYPTAFQTLKPKPHIQDIITFDNESIQQDTIDIPTSELNESQLSEDLDYMLDQAAELSQIQQRQIISLFEKYANQYINVFEELDGYLDVVQYNADDEKAERIILISTLAVYIMDPDDFSTELRRIPLDAIILLRASRSLKHLLIQVDDEEEKGDVCVFTDRMSDLVRAIQSVYYEMRGYYVMIQFEDSLEGLKQKMNSESTESIVDLNYSVAQNRLNGILIRRGNIGETIQKLFQCVLDDQER